MAADERVERARLLHERFRFDGDADVLAEADREPDAVGARGPLPPGATPPSAIWPEQVSCIYLESFE